MYSRLFYCEQRFEVSMCIRDNIAISIIQRHSIPVLPWGIQRAAFHVTRKIIYATCPTSPGYVR
jgi:hypothetical protein